METRANDFLLLLYRAARRMRHAEFQPWVFSELDQLVQFDSAFWYRWAISETISPLHAWYLYKQPESLLQEYFSTALWEDDIIYHRAKNGVPGVAHHVSYEDYTSERMKSFLRRHCQYQVMTIGIWQEVPQIAGGFSLYRNETRPPFEPSEAQIIELVAPHLLETWRENWLHEVVRASSSGPTPVDFSMAVVMPNKLMSEAQVDFSSLLREEFYTWTGPWLPEDLNTYLDQNSLEPWIGRQIALYQRKQPDEKRLLLARRRHPWDRLQPRKRQVATLFAQGDSQTVVAAKVNLSPSTVNNYIGSVYQELHLTDKTDLSRLVFRLTP